MAGRPRQRELPSAPFGLHCLMLLIFALLATSIAAIIALLTAMGNANLPAPSVQAEGPPLAFWLVLLMAVIFWVVWLGS